MVFSYSVNDNIFTSLFESNHELEFEKLKVLLYLIKKNSIFIDCYYDGRYEAINKDWMTLYNAFNDDANLKKTLEIIFLDGILKNRVNLPKTKPCNCNECSLQINVSSIKKHIPRFPDFILSHKNDWILNSPILCSTSSIQDATFKKLFDRTCYEEELLLDYNSGVQRIEKNWGALISLCKEKITIMDQNIWSKWRINYQKGLEQFVKVVSSLNPDLVIEIITSFAPHEEQKSKYDIKKEISDTFNQLLPVKVKLLLSDTEKFDHDRFILFDELIGAELGRGLDTFYAATRSGEAKIKNYRINYYSVAEVKKYMAEPLRNKTRNPEFITIQNY